MILEDRDDEGRPTYQIVCTECGQMFGGHPLPSGLFAAREAHMDGWDRHGDSWYCRECSPGRWEYEPPQTTDKVGRIEPEYVCQNCRYVTKSKKAPGKRCPKCKVLLWPELT